MELYAAYAKERYGNEVFIEENGFAEFNLTTPPHCFVINVFVVKEMRRTKVATDLLDKVVEKAKGAKCKNLWCEVQINALNCNDSLQAALAYGFSVQATDQTKIVLFKNIGG